MTEILGQFSKRDNERIFVISRLGKSEKTKLIESRLRKIFQKFDKVLGVKPDNIIIASGPRNKSKEGAIDLYLVSELFMVLLPKVGEDIFLTSGGIDPEELK